MKQLIYLHGSGGSDQGSVSGHREYKTTVVSHNNIQHMPLPAPITKYFMHKPNIVTPLCIKSVSEDLSLVNIPLILHCITDTNIFVEKVWSEISTLCCFYKLK